MCKGDKLKMPPTNQANTMYSSNEESNKQASRMIASRQRIVPTRRKQLALVAAILVCHLAHAACQLPDDIQRELNQGLAEQARIQAMRSRHQQQMQARAGGKGDAPPPPPPPATSSGQPAHDPNNYSYQQAPPPVQYSYYQPYGDLAQQNQPATGDGGGGGGGGGGFASPPARSQQQQQQQPPPPPPINIDLNNLNIDIPNLPTPQAQTAGRQPAQRRQSAHHMTPHFTGAGGLPVLQPMGAANRSPDTFAPLGQAPLQAQAQVAGAPNGQQQGPPLTEADFKDITGGENYGAPGGSDFGMPGQASAGGDSSSGEANQSAEPRQGAEDNTDAQLREFGMPNEQQQQPVGASQSRQDNPMAGMMSDFGGGLTPMGGTGSRRRQGGGASGFDPFAMAGAGGGAPGGGGGLPFGSDFGGLGGGGARGGQGRRQSRPSGDFDFASQPSDQSEDGGGAGGGGSSSGAAPSVRAGAAPGSLQSLLGNAFPGLEGGGAGANTGNMGLEALTRGQNEQGPGGGRSDDVGGALDIADMGDQSDGLLGAGDLGGGGGEGGGGGGGADGGAGDNQQGGGSEPDFNFAAAAAEQQPRTVPYPDAGPQFVGTILAVTQPQSLTQQRYNPLPDKGTYQDYPAYGSGGNNFGAVSGVVDQTPRARAPGPGRYGLPTASQLAPEHKQATSAGQYNYAQSPLSSMNANNRYSASSPEDEFDDADNFVD